MLITLDVVVNIKSNLLLCSITCMCAFNWNIHYTVRSTVHRGNVKILDDTHTPGFAQKWTDYTMCWCAHCAGSPVAASTTRLVFLRWMDFSHDQPNMATRSFPRSCERNKASLWKFKPNSLEWRTCEKPLRCARYKVHISYDSITLSSINASFAVITFGSFSVVLCTVKNAQTPVLPKQYSSLLICFNTKLPFDLEKSRNILPFTVLIALAGCDESGLFFILPFTSVSSSLNRFIQACHFRKTFWKIRRSPKLKFF